MNFLRRILQIVILVLGGFFMATSVFALTPEEEAAKHGITFPAADLGNCNSVTECMTYCDQPVNYDVCIAFAKKHGFYQEPSQIERDILEAVKNELGCDSETSCFEYCTDSANRSKCIESAKRHGLEHEKASPPEELIESARNELGCNSKESCLDYCEAEGNWSKCEEFFRKHGFEQPKIEGEEDFCKKFPEKCQDRNHDDFCKKSPEECKRKEEDFCKQYPEKCQPPPYEEKSQPLQDCPTGHYKALDGVCVPESYNQAEYDCNKQGKYWDGSNCRDSYAPPQENYSPPPDYQQYENYQQQYQEPQVYGVSTKSWWQKISDFILGIL